jgi:hypothetical protein
MDFPAELLLQPDGETLTPYPLSIWAMIIWATGSGRNPIQNQQHN